MVSSPFNPIDNKKAKNNINCSAVIAKLLVMDILLCCLFSNQQDRK